MCLNGKTLEFAAAGAYLNINTASEVTINGKVSGSEITKNITNGTNEKLVSATGTTLNMVGGTYSMYGTYSTAAIAVRSENTTTDITMAGCSVIADANAPVSVRCAQFYGTSSIDNCSLTATNQAGSTIAILAISGSDSLTVRNSKLLSLSYDGTQAETVCVQTDATTTTIEKCIVSSSSPAPGIGVGCVVVKSGTASITESIIKAEGNADSLVIGVNVLSTANSASVKNSNITAESDGENASVFGI